MRDCSCKAPVGQFGGRQGRNDEIPRGEPVGLPVYVYFSYLFIYVYIAGSPHLKLRHRPCLRRSFDPRPVQARPTLTPTFGLLLKPSSIRLFPCSSDTGPSSPCEISALRPRSTRSLQPCSCRMKSSLPSLSMRSLLSLARCRTLISSQR